MSSDLYLFYLAMLLGKCIIELDGDRYSITYELANSHAVTHGHFQFDINKNEIVKNKDVLEWFLNKFLAQ